jgi:hypothetical protein
MDERKTLKVKCFITGEESTYSSEYVKKLTEKYGSKENIQRYYITMKAKDLLFKGYSIPEIRKILVTKTTKLEDPDSEHGLDLLKFWQDKKTCDQKFKLRDNDKSISFSKTDDDVKAFIDGWLNQNK